MPVITPVESLHGQADNLDLSPCPRGAHLPHHGFPYGASTFTTFDDARVAISYMRSENPVDRHDAFIAFFQEFSTDAQSARTDAESGMVIRFRLKNLPQQDCVSSMQP